MKNILILNGGKSFGHSNGRLNNTLTSFAEDKLKEMGCNVQTTEIDSGYDVEAEIEKWIWADVVVHQMPGWWMGPPWIVKKYMDEVFTLGHGRLYDNDGRTRSNPLKTYGSGGLLEGKYYMLSVTWNAPKEAFEDPSQFFEGVGVDGIYFPIHKAHQFLGMSPLNTFICYDVIKNPDVCTDILRYEKHLKSIFPMSISSMLLT
ncbi:NAD(P)H-dependent oxidoreductase [Vibrio sp. EA2]|uniref:NAD(P)H-dependent oxidoreductase n=1 Tax=Vibrio sp. EA2 TaxID=3079860 RepID=UPI0029492988|nr:NAD(P)H-dependent oxidoreductase [Vibrio sp. EA2]MDV6253515.1 NAD(P)H-dependent oxidoreductase [Vibrio sp. EA2]